MMEWIKYTGEFTFLSTHPIYLIYLICILLLSPPLKSCTIATPLIGHLMFLSNLTFLGVSYAFYTFIRCSSSSDQFAGSVWNRRIGVGGLSLGRLVICDGLNPLANPTRWPYRVW